MILAVAQSGITGYVVLFVGVAASWLGIPLVGAGVLAAAGVLASDGELNIWLVIAVATAAGWTGGYVGFVLGAHASDAVTERPGRWQHQRRRAIVAGRRLYRTWGRVAVFVTPTWVSGALRMPRRTFLVWNLLAAFASTCIAALSAYGIGAAVVGQLQARRGVLALVVAVLALAAVAISVLRHRRASGDSRGSDRSGPRAPNAGRRAAQIAARRRATATRRRRLGR